MCCNHAAIISHGPSAVIMMFAYKEIIDKMEKNLTNPKFHEVLVLDDEQAKEKRDKIEQEKKKEKEKKEKTPTTRPKNTKTC